MKQLRELGRDTYSAPSEPLDYIRNLIESQAAEGADYIAVNLDAFGEDEPQIAIDMLSAIIDFIQIEIDEISGYALLIQIMFIQEQESIQGHFYLLPDRSFLDLMLKEIDTYHKD